MSGYERGQRYRLVVEGEFASSDPVTGRISLEAPEACYTHVNPDHVVSVEKVEPPKPPLPTTPGSVIRGRTSGYVWLLRDNDKWVSQGKPSRRINGLPPTPNHYEVIFDAGAAS